MKKTIQQTGEFTARDDTGREYTIVILQEFNDGVPGMRSYRTDSGRAVNRKAKGEFEIVGHPNVPITPDDPNAAVVASRR